MNEEERIKFAIEALEKVHKIQMVLVGVISGAAGIIIGLLISLI